MRPVHLLSSSLLLLACATPQSEKMAFEEAFRAEAGAARTPPAAAPRAKGKRPALRAEASGELQASLVSFAARARSVRAGVPLGSPLPAAQAANWRGVCGAIDNLLARAAAQTSSFDLIRARVTLEAELELDARSFGDFPPQLAQQVLDQVTRLAVRMSQVRELGVKARHRLAAFIWPVEPVAVTSIFGRRLHPVFRVTRPHFGVDLAAEEGQLVSAAAAGTVLHAGWNGSYGRRIELRHAGGVVTRYGHLSQLLVEPGLRVGRGDPIGLAGNTGASTGAHLHFEVLRDGKPCDPLFELGQPPPPSISSAGSTSRGVGGPP